MGKSARNACSRIFPPQVLFPMPHAYTHVPCGLRLDTALQLLETEQNRPAAVPPWSPDQGAAGACSRDFVHVSPLRGVHCCLRWVCNARVPSCKGRKTPRRTIKPRRVRSTHGLASLSHDFAFPTYIFAGAHWPRVGLGLWLDLRLGLRLGL